MRPARRQKTLNEEGPTDEAIHEVFNFEECKPWDIEKVPFVLNGVDVLGFGGNTFPFRPDFLEIEGCDFKHVIDGKVIKMWVMPADADVTALEEKIAEYGFNLIEYDEAEEELGSGDAAAEEDGGDDE